MSDRELMELAAKAVGMEYPNGQTYCETMGVWGMLEKRPYSWWNPITDDGDALRMAVKLHLTIDRSEVEPAAYIYCDWQDADVVVNEPHGLDPYAATRRAIVRAAAEIGKEMP